MNVASRLQEIAVPGQVVVSAAVRDRLDETDSLEPLGEQTLKNVPEPVECFGVST